MERLVPGERLPNSRREAFDGLLSALAQSNNEALIVQTNIDEFVGLMDACCGDDPMDAFAMATELREWVRWTKAPAYCLTYIFQVWSQQHKSAVHISAALLFAEAQQGVADDMAMLSTEVAWRAARSAASSSADQATMVAPLLADIESRLRSQYRYYYQWSRPFDYLECDPLSEHLYFRRTWWDLAEAYRGETKALSSHVPQHARAAILDDVAKAAHANGDTYHSLIARRAAANERRGFDLEAAHAQLTDCLESAREVCLDAEIGHLLRLRSHVRLLTGDLDGAQSDLMDALTEEVPVDLCVYWRALTERELGDVRGRMIPKLVVQQADPDIDGILESVLGHYRQGRFLMDLAVNRGGPPVGSAVKRQMNRSYADNALNRSLEAGVFRDALAEIESSGPQGVARALIEGLSLAQTAPDVTSSFTEARELMQHHLSSMPTSFEDYLAALPEEYEARRRYHQVRDTITVLSNHMSDDIASRILGHGGDGLILAFSLGPRYTCQAVLVDLKTHEVHHTLLGKIDHIIRDAKKTFDSELLEAEDDVGYPPVGARNAVHRFIDAIGNALSPALEMVVEHASGRRLIIVPQTSLHAVPFAALSSGSGVLIDVVASLSVVPSLGMAAELLDVKANVGQNVAVTALLNQPKAPLDETAWLAGMLHAVAQERSVSVVPDPAPDSALAVLASPEVVDVVLACHGQYRSDDPSDSWLRVREGALLSVADIAARLAASKTRCVVLSACESGLARTEIGSEYIGLVGTMLGAGVPSVVGSLWKIPPVATAVILDDCFKRLGQHGDLPFALAESQRRARTMTRDDVKEWVQVNMPESYGALSGSFGTMPVQPFSHPYDWAGLSAAGIGLAGLPTPPEERVGRVASESFQTA